MNGIFETKYEKKYKGLLLKKNEYFPFAISVSL